MNASLTAYEQAVETLHRATAIYTRAPIAAQMLERLAWPENGGRLVDPSCGDGVFLVEALRRRGTRDCINDATALAATLCGWEIHAGAAAEARVAIATELVAQGWDASAARDAAAGMVTTGDFLTDTGADDIYSTIASNPPYMRRANVPMLLRDRYDALLPRWTRADLQHAFLAAYAERLAPGGQIALVTSDRWLGASSSAQLREELGKRVGITHLGRLDPGSAFHRPKQRRAGTPARVHPVEVHLQDTRAARPLSRAPLYPDALDDAPHTGLTLGDVASIRLAPWLGPEGIFVVDESTARGIPEATVPAVDTDDVVQGVLSAPRRFAIRTEPGVAPSDALRSHLDRTLARMPPRGKRVPHWLPPETFHRWTLDAPALLIPRIARGLVPVELPAGVLPVNHNLQICAATADATLAQIRAVLTSEATASWIRARAPMLESGFYSITTTLLRQIPWPLAIPAAPGNDVDLRPAGIAA